MTRIFGYIFLIIGLVSFLFFKEYRGYLINYQIVWLIVSILFEILGCLLIRFHKKKPNDLKLKGERIKLDFDSCTFKTNNYLEELNSDFHSRTELLDDLYDSNSNYHTENKNETVIIYALKNGNNTETFISNVFPLEEVNLKFHVTNGDVFLYIEKDNRNNYLFDLET